MLTIYPHITSRKYTGISLVTLILGSIAISVITEQPYINEGLIHKKY